jgi:NAD(P)-dependent dehydrogenase (short-subunit alcohol dehydrogenase family)
VFFITGAARGIGAAVAAEAASRGARVALSGIEPEELEARAAELGPPHAHFEADVTDLDSVEAAVAGTIEQFGRIDLVLANAGIAAFGTVEKGDPEAFFRSIDINLNGVYRTVYATLPHLLESRGWVGIVSSIAAYAPLPGSASYNASKAGVELFTRALRAEVGFRGVAAASIHPSWIDTDLVRDAADDLVSFRELRARLIWPAKATTSVEQCARAIVDGAESRQDRVFVPRSTRLIFWLRNLIGSRLGEVVIGRETPEVVPQMEAEIAALGRHTSARTATINRLSTTPDRS